ncbi:hypothetical protein RHA1_ro05425 [Rhodococcus jostii RHA1]|uniref:Uncharacterized protein n=1 Tax=Rhodococcus jostii (strain RHA1) TaxID=101510 RepID=Q0S5I1_RHOJR|nr:hypothetical protein RHA1_ro05425 [Rhodococcus jostii RHA1]
MAELMLIENMGSVGVTTMWSAGVEISEWGRNPVGTRGRTAAGSLHWRLVGIATSVR